MSEQLNLVPLTVEKVENVVRPYGAYVHGDYKLLPGSFTHVDVEFSSLINACSFAQIAPSIGWHVIMRPKLVTSLNDSVVLVITKSLNY